MNIYDEYAQKWYKIYTKTSHVIIALQKMRFQYHQTTSYNKYNLNNRINFCRNTIMHQVLRK
jgi:hypothetical protein